MIRAIRSAAKDAPLYIRDAADIFVLLAIPDRMRLRSPGERPLAPVSAPRTRIARRSPA